MARVAEIAPGVQYQFSAEELQVAASTTRVFRILKNDPSEYVAIAGLCGISVGDEHPQEAGLFCASYSAQYEGDSRMVILATFNYRTTPAGGAGGAGSDRNQNPPDVRPANWSTSSALQEVPAYIWRPISGPGAGEWRACYNPAGDMYEGVTRLEPIVTITIEQFETIDPTRHQLYAGYVNTNPIQLGSLAMFPRSCMFRGVQTSPSVEHWGNKTFRGWKASYEFAFRVNWIGSPFNTAIGWDIAVPQTGFNVRTWLPSSGGVIDQYSQPLKHSDGAIATPLALPEGSFVDQKARAHVRVFESQNGKTSQRPSAQPIALNDDGTGRSLSASPPVIVHRYQVQNDIDFTLFGLRLT